MKTWEEMSNKERAEQTIRDIKRRQALREKQIEKGKKDAVDYIFDKEIVWEKEKESQY